MAIQAPQGPCLYSDGCWLTCAAVCCVFRHNALMNPASLLLYGLPGRLAVERSLGVGGPGAVPGCLPLLYSVKSRRFGMRTRSAAAGAAGAAGAAWRRGVRQGQCQQPSVCCVCSSSKPSASRALPILGCAPGLAPAGSHARRAAVQPAHGSPSTGAHCIAIGICITHTHTHTHPIPYCGYTSRLTRVPGVYQLQAQAGRQGRLQRQHEAHGADGEVQAAPLHRYDVDLLRVVWGRWMWEMDGGWRWWWWSWREGRGMRGAGEVSGRWGRWGRWLVAQVLLCSSTAVLRPHAGWPLRPRRSSLGTACPPRSGQLQAAEGALACACLGSPGPTPLP